MPHLPSDEEIRARAEELKLIEPGADLPRDVRKRVAKVLLDEQKAPKPPAAPEPILLSRTTQPALGGLLRVDVVFVPNPASPTPTQEGNTT